MTISETAAGEETPVPGRASTEPALEESARAQEFRPPGQAAGLDLDAARAAAGRGVWAGPGPQSPELQGRRRPPYSITD